MMKYYPANFEQKTGFDKIRTWLASKCLSPLGVSMVEKLQPSADMEEIGRNLLLTVELKDICLKGYDFPAANFPDLRPAFIKATIEGVYLDTDELILLNQFLNGIKAMVRFFQLDQSKNYVGLRKLAGEIILIPALSDTLEKILNKHGKIKDSASPQLAVIRSEILKKQNLASKQLSQLLKDAREKGYSDSDASPAMRDGRLVIPVAAPYKRRIRGFIHDESATGKTVFIEPVEVVELNNEIRELEFEEHREIIKILQKFTQFLRPYIPDLLNYAEYLALIDFIRAKALLAIEMNAVKPCMENKPVIEWHEALNPVLLQAFKTDGRKVIPMSLKLDDNQHIMVISGPNAGGKSVCLTTAGLLQYMFQCGLLVPVLETSRFGIFEKILIDIGDEQSIENDLSTYSSHLRNMKYFLKNVGYSTLILIDEFGAGTDPLAGGAIAEALLAAFARTETLGIITTHYSNLKHFATSTSGIVNAAMLYDINRMQPLFILETGQPGSSFAFDIARNTGLPSDVVENAIEKAGTGPVQFDKLLRQVIRDKKYWEQKRDKIHRLEKTLETRQEEFLQLVDEIKQQRKTILEKTREDARNMLNEVNRRIEKTIREIKEAGAEKEKTRQIRLQMEKFKKTILENNCSESDQPEKLAAFERKNKALRNSKIRNKEQFEKDPESKGLVPGDKVTLAGYDTPGEVITASNNKMVVTIGHMLMTVSPDKLTRISQGDYRKAMRKAGITPSTLAVDLSKRRLEFRTGIDVRGLRSEEAMQKIEMFIDEAIVLNAGEVKILHGKGDGILRQQIRRFLKKYSEIESVTDEHIDFGGAGISVVKFKN